VHQPSGSPRFCQRSPAHRCASIFCIIPPHVFDRIARNGNDEQRGWALDTLHRDHSVRTARLQNTLIGVPSPQAAQPLRFGAAPDLGRVTRTIFDMSGSEVESDLPGQVVREEGGDKTEDPAADEAYEGLGATFELYWDVFKRNSIDDAGLPLHGIVHYGQKYDNAFWDGQEMIFGDGDGELFNRFTISIDVIGHELTHGVTQNTANLQYLGQSGAMNESISDVFGSLVKQYDKKQTAADADWLIGEGLLAPGVEGTALRSLKEPGSAYNDDVLGPDPQPKHMDGYVQTSQDNGGVHVNSGIPNHAFYLFATSLGGNAWDRAGPVWYSALRDPRLQTSAQFVQFASATSRAANRLYPGTDVGQQLHEAWKAVGIDIDRATREPA
jgi:Zn-dependent metalloprotease